MSDSATPWTAARQAFLSITSSRNLLKLMSIELVMPSNHLILCGSLLLPSIFPWIRVFFNESVLPIRWPKYWNFSYSISPSNEYAGLISFRIDWFDFLAVQGTLKSLLQHHNSKALIFFSTQLSYVAMKLRHLFLGRKAITNLDSILKSRDITLLTKIKAMVFPVVVYGCESWTIRKAEHQELMLLKLWCWRRLLRVPWTARRSNWSILKEINPEYSLGGW